MIVEELKEILAGSVSDGDLPFVVAMVANRQETLWSGSAGSASAECAADLSTGFRLFSMTKAVGAVAAMILVDRGMLSLDDEVASILPEFDRLRVLEHGGDQSVPSRWRPPRQPVTVRHLATHTSGLAYEFWCPTTARILQDRGMPGVLSGTRASLQYPLMFDPGESWAYGIGFDWLGLVIEAVDGRSIDGFVRQEILEPLGMQATAFEPDPSWESGLASVRIRGEDGSMSELDFGPPSSPEVYGLGHALYGSAPDYMRFLRFVLGGGSLEGTRLLSENAVRTMLSNHIGTLNVPEMRSTVPALAADVDILPGTRKTHSLACLRFEEGAQGMRGPGTLGWAGALNTHYWVDPERDIAAVFMTQLLPFADQRVMSAYERFERAVYRRWPPR